MVDYVNKEYIFNFFLYVSCVPLAEAHFLMSRMMTDPRMSWKKPIEIFGSNVSFHLFKVTLRQRPTAYQNITWEKSPARGLTTSYSSTSGMRLKASRNWIGIGYLGSLAKTVYQQLEAGH